jgi:hypothetical protein
MNHENFKEFLIFARHLLWSLVTVLFFALLHYDLPKIGAWLDKDECEPFENSIEKGY